jgi:hypothetical protein
MVRKSRNVNINTPNVTVSSLNTPAIAPARSSRNRRRRVGRTKRNVAARPGLVTAVSSGMELMSLQEMNRGRMTADPSSDIGFIRSLLNGRCDMDVNTEGWYFKYLDPAGAVETARAVGEFSKIPDGLLTFSVDAEIRTVETFTVPMIENESGVPGDLPLSGLTWSLTIFSYPMFRTAYIAVANRFDKELSPSVASELAFVLNNLTDYRATIDMNDWSPFAELVEDGWFFWIKPLPPTYNLADPVVGDQRTLTSWRMSYKSLTIEHNAPTLIDQGFWNGAHYALDPSIVQQSTEHNQQIDSYVHGRNLSTQFVTVPANIRFTIRIPNLPQISTVAGPATLNSLSTSLYITTTGDTTSTPVSWIVAPNTAMYNPFEVVFAEPGDTVSFTSSVVGTTFVVTFISTSVGSTPFTLVFQASTTPPFILLNGAEALTQIYVDSSTDLFENRTSNQIEFPAYTTDQIAANNPKMEQFLMKETNGAYLVHKKMRKPVFEVTPAGSFGPIQFTTPDYLTSRNANDGSGILDTIDSNFSTASCCVRGIAHANVPVIKLYQGWEGITNVNTPFGQFGHTGLPRNDCVMQLVDNLTVRTTGVYPANDNFLGLIANFAANALKGLLSSEATPAMLGNLAQGVINQGLSFANNKLGQIGQRTIRRTPGRSNLIQPRAGY